MPVLFDYAVARLYIPAEAADLVNLLTKEADLLIAIRPSIELHFQRLWHHDQTSFWELTFQSLSSPLNEVGKLLGPSVAALHATATSQTKPLLDCLNDPARNMTGIAALQHILATLLTYGTTTGSIRPGPWLDFVDTATATLTPALANAVRPYINFAAENASKLSDSDRSHVGAMARRLLSFAVATTPPNLLFAMNGITAIAKTVATDPVGSIAVLRQCITPEHLKNYDFRTFSTLAQQMPDLVTVDAGFVHDVYVAGFGHSEQSDEKTLMGDSQILPMSSNRKPDYETGFWSLGEKFPGFLKGAPREALDALLRITHQYVRDKPKATDAIRPVVLDEHQSGLLPDYSSIWGNGVSHHHDPVKMIQVFQHYLQGLVDEVQIKTLVYDIAAQDRPAVIWRILLSSGTRHPSTIGRVIRSLAWDHTILTDRDTTSLAGAFLQVIYPFSAHHAGCHPAANGS